MRFTLSSALSLCLRFIRVLFRQASPSYGMEKKQALGMLEHLSSELGPESKLGARTRAMLPSVSQSPDDVFLLDLGKW